MFKTDFPSTANRVNPAAQFLGELDRLVQVDAGGNIDDVHMVVVLENRIRFDATDVEKARHIPMPRRGEILDYSGECSRWNEVRG